MWYVLGTALLGMLGYLWERGNRADVEKRLLLSEALAKDLKRQFGMEQDRAYRNEQVIHLLRGDIGELERELEACAVPGSIRNRLSRMLTSPDRKPDGRL